MKDEASYVCDACGEEIVVPIDLSAGTEQEYVEDCPVCCCPNVVHVEVDEDGDVRVWTEREKPISTSPRIGRSTWPKKGPPAGGSRWPGRSRGSGVEA